AAQRGEAGPGVGRRVEPLLLVCIALSAAVLVLDSRLPAEYAFGLLYVAVMMLGFWLRSRPAVITLAALSSGFVLLGYMLSPASPSWGSVATVTNRSLAFMTIWWTAVLALRHQASVAALRRSEAGLQEAQRIAGLGRFEL